MADAWLGISSAHYDSHCGDYGTNTLVRALDGLDYWRHDVAELHWFILDLGETYTITKVRGRSNYIRDPTDVDIFVSDDKENWGVAVKYKITTWQNTSEWVEVAVTEKNGRYIKVEIGATEHADNLILFGSATPFTIFDAYGDVAAPPVVAPTVTTQAVTDIEKE